MKILTAFSVGLCVLLSAILLCQGSQSVDTSNRNNGIGFGFPEEDEQNKANQNAMNKKPVLLPSRCGQDELFYPGDQADDWFCDCRPGFLFHPPKNQCYEAFKRGPCEGGEYLTLPKNSVIPECTHNPCQRDKFVRFKSVCYELGKAGPCPLPELGNVIGVDETTLEIVCTKGNDFFKDRIEDPIVKCPIGGRLWCERKCPQQRIMTTETVSPELSLTMGRMPQ